MRIALLHYTCPPVAGGVERILADHARLFADHGHEVTVLAGEGDATVFADSRIDLQILPEIRRAEGGSLGAGVEDQLRALLVRHEVVFLHNVLTMPFHLPLTEALWRIAEVALQTRVFAWIHDVAAANPDYAPGPVLLQRAHPSIRYVAVSELRRREWCAASGQPLSRCGVIPNGVHLLERLRLTPVVERFAEEFGILQRDPVLLHPTRLLRRKNVELSLRIVAELVRAAPPMSHLALLITGAADAHNPPAAAYVRELRELTDELELWDHVRFVCDHFAPTDADVDSLYALADAVLYPSHHEGFGLPILEAALHRLPIFASDVEPLNSLLPAEDLTLFRPETPPEQIAAEIRRQLEVSPTVRNRKAVVRRFGWTRIYENFLAPLLAETETGFYP